MKINITCLLVMVLLLSCTGSRREDANTKSPMPIEGTWKLLSGTLIEKGDTVVTDYTKNIAFIKIINATHFAFLQHDVNKGKDSAAAVYVSGGGNYSLTDSSYTEHLEYCSARNWEGNDFAFTVSIQNDTLIQKGIEKIDSIGVNRLNIEKYIRLKK